MKRIQTLVSLPPAAAALGSTSMVGVDFACSDPPGHQLGSGGGTANLLWEAWKALAPNERFEDWLAGDRKLMIHASGQSRRLPAYAAEGKARLPLPLMNGEQGQTPDQTLVDLQRSAFVHLLRHAPDDYVLAVACGDTLVRFPAALPVFPRADVLIVGIPSTPEKASAHGVMFTPQNDPNGTLEFFLQKPAPDVIRAHAATHDYTLDSGVWLLTRRAVMALMTKCGWDEATQTFRFAGAPDGTPGAFELYDRFGTALGAQPAEPDPVLSPLAPAVLALREGLFYHFGTNRSVMESIAELADPAGQRHSFGSGTKLAGDGERFVFHSVVDAACDAVRPLWIENSHIPASWSLSGEHVLTGIPENNLTVALPRGVCVDSAAFDDDLHEALRVYGFDDAFKGPVGNVKTKFLGAPFSAWLMARGLSFEDAGLDPNCDLQNAPLFPLVDWSDPATGELLQWMAGNPDGSVPAGGANAAASAPAKAWLAARRVSATDFVQRAALSSRLARRAAIVRDEFARMPAAEWSRNITKLDLAEIARGVKAATLNAPAALPDDASALAHMHDAILAESLGASAPRGAATAQLRDILVGDLAKRKVKPRCNLISDQIVWGRSPARLDIAGGWSDTPPYCLENGGRVVNLAVDLNGQPPIQCFVRICAEPVLRLHSIDLGLDETIETREDLCATNELGPFSIPRAALRLVGFDNQFFAGTPAPTLREQLEKTFGGGLEVSTLCAIPKGSGLGTSSILAATVIGAIAEACGLGWDAREISARTSVLEQLLSSGGGWQDQLGGLFGGAKMLRTLPGLRQDPDVQLLPTTMLRTLIRDGRALLYYTGVTRVARDILANIVRNIFLNDRTTLSTIGDIAYNADFVADALQHADEARFCEALRRSWDLNRTLDAGTCPASVAPIADVFEKHGAAFKLLGAGGGGYLFGIAPTRDAAAAIREDLAKNPPNPRARFVEVSLSDGFQVTRS